MSGGKVKLGDFGLFKILSSDDEEIPLELGNSKFYAPPEVYQKTGTNSTADIWPLGMICLEAITGTITYKSYSLLEDDPNSYFEVRQRIVNKNPFWYCESYSMKFRHLVWLMCRKVADDRPQAADLLKMCVF